MLKIFKFDNTNASNKIAEMEKNLGINLPSEYREFLEKYNGGRTIGAKFSINGISTLIRAFYGVEKAPHDFNFTFLNKNNFLTEHVEKGFLPIATDTFDNDVVIAVDGGKYGEIYFFDSELRKYTFLTDTFKEFIDKIKSENVIIRTIDQRIEDLKKVENPIEVDDDIIAIWQEEIDKFGGTKQETVINNPTTKFLG